MSFNTFTTTLTPNTPDKQYRSNTYLISNSSSPVAKSSGTPNKSPSNGPFSSSPDPVSTPMTERAITPANEHIVGEGEWSSAVGRASVAGKSGRVIERLMGEVDKLKRELNLAQARVEEEQSRSVSAREALDSLRGTKENLEAICETNRNIITRRDRKIEELKGDLESERSQRNDAERGRNELSVEMQALRRDSENEVRRASDIATRATAEYETFKKSLQRMKTDWEKQLGQMRRELDVVQQDRDSEKVRLKSLNNVCNELRAQQYQIATSYDRVNREYGLYKQQMDDAVRDMAARISSGESANQKLNSDLKKTLGDMKWVINVHENVTSLRSNKPASAG